MSEQTDFSEGNGVPGDRWQANLLTVARGLPYPPAPDVRAAVAARLASTRRAPRWPLGRPPVRLAGPVRLAWVIAVLLVALLALLAVPAVRAALLDFLQIGAVRILVSPTSTPIATSTRPAATAVPSPTPLLSVLDLAGQTTLADARQRAGFTLRLPAYPADLGQPDIVFVQEVNGRIVILVWREPGDQTQVRLVLEFINSSAEFEKSISAVKEGPLAVEFGTVNGQTAIWTTGPYILETRAGTFKQQRLIQGHVLIWTDGVLTYRLETNLTMAEAERIAESLGQ